MSDQQPTCEQRIEREMHDRVSAISAANTAAAGRELTDEDKNRLEDYGWDAGQDPREWVDEQFIDSLILGIDVPDTDAPPCVRFQMSTGGPGDEFRAYFNAYGHIYRWTYCFLDWWDFAERELGGADRDGVAFLLGDLAEHKVYEVLNMED